MFQFIIKTINKDCSLNTINQYNYFISQMQNIVLFGISLYSLFSCVAYNSVIHNTDSTTFPCYQLPPPISLKHLTNYKLILVLPESSHRSII